MQYFLVQFPRHLIAARSAINTIYAHLLKHLTSSEPQNKFITLRAQTLLDFIAMSNAPQSTHLTGQVHLLLLPLFLSRLESSTTLNPGQHSKLVRDRYSVFFCPAFEQLLTTFFLSSSKRKKSWNFSHCSAFSEFLFEKHYTLWSENISTENLFHFPDTTLKGGEEKLLERFSK